MAPLAIGRKTYGSFRASMKTRRQALVFTNIIVLVVLSLSLLAAEHLDAQERVRAGYSGISGYQAPLWLGSISDYLKSMVSLSSRYFFVAALNPLMRLAVTRFSSTWSRLSRISRPISPAPISSSSARILINTPTVLLHGPASGRRKIYAAKKLASYRWSD